MDATPTRNPKDWQRSVPSIIAVGQHLAEKRKTCSPAEFQKHARAEFMVDRSTAQKLTRLVQNPVISNPKYADKLPPEWGKLYELCHLPNDVLIKLIEDGSVWRMLKYDIWKMRGINTDRWKGRESGGPKNRIIPPPGMSISDWVRSGLKSEAEGGFIPWQAAKAIGMGRAAYTAVRPLLLLLDRDDLLPEDRAIIQRALDAVTRHQRVKGVPELDEADAVIEKFWKTGRHGKRYVRQGDKAETKRKEAFFRALVVICDTCNNGADIHVPFLSKEEAASAMDKLHTAKASLIKLGRRLWRQSHE